MKRESKENPVGYIILIVIAILTAIAGVVYFLIMVLLPVVMLKETNTTKTNQTSGIENYDKANILKEYGGDINGGLFLFPENTDAMVEPEYVSSMKSGLLDSEGYIILKTGYSEQDYEAEIERLSKIECSLSFQGEKVTQRVRYDTQTYALPAYVAVDGYDCVYEYALVDENTKEITYVLLSYPDPDRLGQYKRYLKKNNGAYDVKDPLSCFSIYAHSFDGGESYTEYSAE